jgi:hypothetical protein
MAHHSASRPARHGLLAAAVAAALVGASAALGQVVPLPAAPPPAAAAAPVAAPPAVPVAPVVAPMPPAVLDIQQQIDQKQYPAAIKAAAKLLALHGNAAAGFSRFQVTMLKGDAQLGSKANAAARATYLAAVRETTDPHEQALAVWTAELVKKARGTTYVPHLAGAGNGGANGQPIDLIDRDSRKLAFGALLDDELSGMTPAVKQATRAPNLPAILPVVQQVQSLTELDEIANGSNARTDAVAGGLLDHARNLMANALKGMWTRAGDIHTSATQQVTNGGNTIFVNGAPVQQTVTGQNGLTADNTAELKGMIDTCSKIRDAAETFMPLANGAADKDWGAILNDAKRVAGRANDILQGNYGSTTVTTPNPGDYNNYNNGTYLNGTSVNGQNITATETNGGYAGGVAGTAVNGGRATTGGTYTPAPGTTTTTPPTTPTTPPVTPAPKPSPGDPPPGGAEPPRSNKTTR